MKITLVQVTSVKSRHVKMQFMLLTYVVGINPTSVEQIGLAWVGSINCSVVELIHGSPDEK